MKTSIEQLADQAKKGSRVALEELVKSIRDRVYKLALRMLYLPADADDATQEILIKVITHLDGFRGESAFSTWVYRLACNHLLTAKKGKFEQQELTFDMCRQKLESEIAAAEIPAAVKAEHRIIEREIMIGCMQMMLMCLERDLRVAFILGDIDEIDSKKGAFILNISPAAYRQRLSRARSRLQSYMRGNCGLFNHDNLCQCSRFIGRTAQAIESGAYGLMFSQHPFAVAKNAVSEEQLGELDELQRMLTLFRSHPDYKAPEKFTEGIKSLLDSGRFTLFS